MFLSFYFSLLLPLDINHNAFHCALSTSFTSYSAALTLLFSNDVQVFCAISHLRSAISYFVLHVQFFDRVATDGYKLQYHEMVAPFFSIGFSCGCTKASDARFPRVTFDLVLCCPLANVSQLPLWPTASANGITYLTALLALEPALHLQMLCSLVLAHAP